MAKKMSDNNQSLEWEEVKTEHIVNDKWIDFRRSAYRFPDGSVFEPFYSYSRRNYVVIVARDEDGNYICVRQFRQGIGKVTTEFPAGGIERKDGREYGVVSQNPFAMGYETIKAALAFTAPPGEEQAEQEILLDSRWIDAGNIEAFEGSGYLY